MIKGIKEINFPSYATLDQATISLEEMGDRTITTRVKIDGDITPDFTTVDWMLEYGGETFVLNTKTPQAMKDTTSRCSFVDLTFVSYAENELKRYFFIEMAQVENGTLIANRYSASLRLNCTDFVAAFNKVLNYYFGDTFTMVIANGADITTEVKDISLEYTYLWDALSNFADEDIFNTTWEITAADGKYTITIGASAQKISGHVFQYGYQGGLTKVERQIEDAEIYNQLLGRGGTQNLPYRYFKKKDPNNTAFAADPDACAELADVYFDRLLDVNFRYYIKGWLRNPNRKVSADTATGTSSGTITKASLDDIFEVKALNALFTTDSLYKTVAIVTTQEVSVPSGYAGQIEGTASVTSGTTGAALPEISYYAYRIVGVRTDNEQEYPASALEGGYTYALKVYMTLKLADYTWVDDHGDVQVKYGYSGLTITQVPETESVSDYPVPTEEESDEVKNSWAYQKGLGDTVFSPVEYVKDDESIAAYGVRQGKLDDDDDIYPTIQGVTIDPIGRVDEVVEIGDIKDTDDTVAETLDVSLPGSTHIVYNAYVLENLFSSTSLIKDVTIDKTTSAAARGQYFSVPAGYVGQVDYTAFSGKGGSSVNNPNVQFSNVKVVAVRDDDDEEFPVSYIPGGYTYTLKVTMTLTLVSWPEKASERLYYEYYGIQDISVKATALPSTLATNVFEVWIKNIFQNTQGEGESDTVYAQRVWEPVLGDRAGNEAYVSFSDGFMSVSSDYQFLITAYPTVDRTKELNGVKSEWKLVLQRSDAEQEATGHLVPYENGPKPVAGDHFFFTGIDMPHKYVVRAEQKLNAEKEESLAKKAYANPTWAVEIDPVRINTLEGEETELLADQIKVGRVMEIYDKRFTGGQILQLAIRTLTITWSEGTNILPQVAVVLSENTLASSSAGSSLTPETVQANVTSSVSQLKAVITAQQKRYLSREHEDTAMGRLRLMSGARFGSFATGLAGMGGAVDADGSAELDALTLRHFLEVPELRYNRISMTVGNQWRAPGGGIIESVEIDHDSDGIALNTGVIHLHLEDGEHGKVALDDICMGIYHDGITSSENAVEDLDDSKGNFRFRGFFTVYFRITEVLASDNSSFRYALRPVSDSWTETKHPCEAMHFVCYGSFSDTSRQTSRYSTLTYERFLTGVNDWEFKDTNIGAQFGDLSNLSVFGLSMTGYSAYLNNIYMSGTIQQFEAYPLRLEIDTEGQDTLAYGESLNVTCKVYKGWDDWTAKVTSWKIVRDTGDATADTAWGLLDKAKDFAGTITIEHGVSYSDLGSVGVSTLFTITAAIDDGNTATYSLTI